MRERQEKSRTHASVLSADEPVRHTAALDLLAVVQRRVALDPRAHLCLARIKRAVERLNLRGPELEVTCARGRVAAECHLRRAVGEHVDNLAVWVAEAQNEWGNEEKRLAGTHW